MSRFPRYPSANNQERNAERYEQEIECNYWFNSNNISFYSYAKNRRDGNILAYYRATIH